MDFKYIRERTFSLKRISGVKNYKNLILLGGVFLVTFVIYFWFTKTPYFEDFRRWSEQNIILLMIILILWKALAIVWPPIHGTILTLGAIPVIGWELAYLADILGNILGSSIAYFIGIHYGYALLYKLFDDKVVNKVKKFKVRPHREVEATFVLRILTGSSAVEVVCYGAGLMRIKYINFIIGTVLSHLALGAPAFALIGTAFSPRMIILNVALAVVAVPVIWKLRGRYFE